MQISNPSGLCQLGGLFRATCLVGKADDVTGTMAFPLGARTIAEPSSCRSPPPRPPSGPLLLYFLTNLGTFLQNA